MLRRLSVESDVLYALFQAFNRYDHAEPREDLTDSGFRNAFWIKNDLGDNFPLTLQPGKTLKVGKNPWVICAVICDDHFPRHNGPVLTGTQFKDIV